MAKQSLDAFDHKILRVLQRDSSLTQRQLAEQVGLSQNACWRRLQAINRLGVIKGYSLRLDRSALDLGIVAIVMIKTRHHSREWLQAFRNQVRTIPDIVDFFRIAGDYDYLLKIVTRSMTTYDRIYQMLIDKVELDTVTTYFAMETIEEQRPLNLG